MEHGTLYCTDGFNLIRDALANDPRLHNYFEIGCYDGVSVSRLAREFPHKTIYGLDPFISDGTHETISFGMPLLVAKNNFRENVLGLKNFEWIPHTSQEFLENFRLLTLHGNRFDVSVVLIDGSHRWLHPMTDCLLAMKLIGEREGLVVIDDTDKSVVSHAASAFAASLVDGDRLSEQGVSGVCRWFKIKRR